MALSPTEESFLDKLDKVAPAGLNQFDAFPKLPSTYKTRSGNRGFLTVLVALISFLLVANDIGEFIWGWPTYGYAVDDSKHSFMNVNIDLIVNMPCRFLSVDLRDALGDRLYLSNGFKRDGTLFDAKQAMTLQEHTSSLDARTLVAQSRKSRGLFDFLFRRNKDAFRPTYNYKPDGSACRIYGSMEVKKVTANLHITTAGHGYRSLQHVPHDIMNLSHVVTDFSFGPYFPDMTQPLKNTFEISLDPFVAYQYFLTVVPTTYIAPGVKPVRTNQYSITHYKRVLEPERGTPGVFFKFDLEPLHMTVHQRTTTFVQFLIRIVGVVGGVWCCAGWAFRISSKAIEVVSGADRTAGIVAVEATGAQKKKWGGGELRARHVSRGQNESWYADGNVGLSSPYMNGAMAPSPYSAVPSPFASPYMTHTPALPTGGLGLGTFATQQQQHLPHIQQSSEGSTFPLTPNVPHSLSSTSQFTRAGSLTSGLSYPGTPLPSSPLLLQAGTTQPSSPVVGPPTRKVSGSDRKID